MTPEADEMVNNIKTTIHLSMPIVETSARALAVLQATQENEEEWAQLGAWSVQWLGYIGDLMIAKEHAEQVGVDSELVRLVSTVMNQMGDMRDEHVRLLQLADQVSAEIVRKRNA